jgi:hypothetical protein
MESFSSKSVLKMEGSGFPISHVLTPAQKQNAFLSEAGDEDPSRHLVLLIGYFSQCLSDRRKRPTGHDSRISYAGLIRRHQNKLTCLGFLLFRIAIRGHGGSFLQWVVLV